MNFFRKSSKKVGDDELTALINNVSKEVAFEEQETGDDSGDKVKKDIAYYRKQARFEKAGKRKLFQSLIKLAEEFKRVRNENKPLRANVRYANQTWYEGGLWRAPQVLPAVDQKVGNQQAILRQAVSLSSLFFNLVIVTGFTRVGLAITNSGTVTASSILYFAIFWTIWSKEASYSTRFDTTDLSAKASTLVTCFAVLFMSLSVNASMESEGGSRIMILAAFCSLLNCGLMVRVYLWHLGAEPDTIDHHVKNYALYNTIMNILEAATWICGMIYAPMDYRWLVFTVGVLLALRIPRAFLANDFHAACSKRGVLFILLLGFMLQSVLVVATDFFQYSTPDWEQYSFIGASCLTLFCIKLLYVEDSSTLASDHALLVNRFAALCFNLGQFALLFSTTLMGSGLNLLTHSYLAAAAALPDKAKTLVCGGFAAVLLSIMFIKSMHLKRVPVATPQKAMFIGAYMIQGLATLAIAGITIAMCLGKAGYLQVLMHNDVELMWALSGFALFLVVLSWLDEGLELALQNDEQSSEFLIHPFGFWLCLKPDTGMDEIVTDAITTPRSGNRRSQPQGHLSEFSPLL